MENTELFIQLKANARTILVCHNCREFLDIYEKDVGEIRVCQQSSTFLCQTCIQKLKADICPACKIKYGEHQRSHLFEDVIAKTIPFQCTFSVHGCKEWCLRESKESHEKVCPYRILAMNSPDVLLMACKEKNNTDILAKVLTQLDCRRIDVNYKCKKTGRTAIIEACFSRNQEIIKMILTSPASYQIDFNVTVKVNVRDKETNEVTMDQWNPFMIALAYGLSDVVQCFLKASQEGRHIDLTKRSSVLKLTPFHLVTFCYNTPGMLRLLLNYPDKLAMHPEAIDAQGHSVLDKICINYDQSSYLGKAAIDLWIANHEALEIKDFHQSHLPNALKKVCCLNLVPFVEHFLSHKDLSFNGNHLEEAVIEAFSTNCNITIVNLSHILEYAERQNGISSSLQIVRMTIQFAIENDKIEILDMLIGYSERKSIKPYDDPSLSNLPTPFISACQRGRKKIILTLLKHHQLFNLDETTTDHLFQIDEPDDKRGRTGFELACLRCHTEIVHLVLEAKRNNDALKIGLKYALHMTCETMHRSLKTAAEITRYPDILDFNQFDHRGMTPLFLAVTNGKEDLVNLLMTLKEVDLNFKNTDLQRTVFHEACRIGNMSILKLLAENQRVDVNAKDKNGRTGFHLSCQSTSYEVVQYLLKLGRNIDLNAKDFSGFSGLHCAIESKNDSIVALLLSNVGIFKNGLSAEVNTFWEDKAQFKFRLPNGKQACVVLPMTFLMKRSANSRF